MEKLYVILNNAKLAYYSKAIDTIYFDDTKGLIIPNRGVVLGGPENCKYHTDLDWIMDIVSIIIKDTNHDCEFRIKINSGMNLAEIVGSPHIRIHNTSPDLVEAIYKSCVDYIDFTNEKL